MEKETTIAEIETTKVKFYVYGKAFGKPKILAYFPENLETREGHRLCYEHMGQHSACSPTYIRGKKQATKEQYNDLKIELESIGYKL